MTSLRNGYVINPEPFWRPAYRISPFNTGHVKTNHQLLSKTSYNRKQVDRHFSGSLIPTINGRAAIYLALSFYNLNADDEVWIITTSGNRYISSCVTREIEKVCQWSLHRSERTKLIFLNHEFGFCYENLQELKSTGLPVIEDKALSFASFDSDCWSGVTGDFTIYSLPKFFPIAFGGILQCNIDVQVKSRIEVEPELERSFYLLMEHFMPLINEIKYKRIQNYNYLVEKFTASGMLPFFSRKPDEIPGAFMFRLENADLPGLKNFLQNNGIECSVFYGENAFYIPVHQELVQEDLDFFHFIVNHYLQYGDQ
jgi:hypothetical protein